MLHTHRRRRAQSTARAVVISIWFFHLFYLFGQQSTDAKTKKNEHANKQAQNANGGINTVLKRLLVAVVIVVRYSSFVDAINSCEYAYAVRF